MTALLDLKTDGYASFSLIHQRKKKLWITERIIQDSIAITCDAKKNWETEFDCLTEGSEKRVWFPYLYKHPVTLKHRDIQIVVNDNFSFILHNVTAKISLTYDYYNGVIYPYIHVKISDININEIK